MGSQGRRGEAAGNGRRRGPPRSRSCHRRPSAASWTETLMTFEILPERPDDDALIDPLLDRAFI